jgi:hypothetical protein
MRRLNLDLSLSKDGLRAPIPWFDKVTTGATTLISLVPPTGFVSARRQIASQARFGHKFSLVSPLVLPVRVFGQAMGTHAQHHIDYECQGGRRKIDPRFITR